MSNSWNDIQHCYTLDGKEIYKNNFESEDNTYILNENDDYIKYNGVCYHRCPKVFTTSGDVIDHTYHTDKCIDIPEMVEYLKETCKNDCESKQLSYNGVSRVNECLCG